jgi:hypothetical protein
MDTRYARAAVVGRMLPIAESVQIARLMETCIPVLLGVLETKTPRQAYDSL